MKYTFHLTTVDGITLVFRDLTMTQAQEMNRMCCNKFRAPFSSTDLSSFGWKLQSV